MRNIWIFRSLTLNSFILFDLLTTMTSISHSSEEGNALARTSIVMFGIYPGLALFGLFVTGLLISILCFCKLLLNGRSGKAFLTYSFFMDICFGWFVAGTHFVGGTSWFWLAPDLLRHCLGAGFYFLLLSLFLLKTSRKSYM